MSESSQFDPSRVDDAQDQGRGSAAMLGLVLICSLAGWATGFTALLVANDPNISLFLSAMAFGWLVSGAILVGLRSFRGGA